jgi:hypothetical protein
MADRGPNNYPGSRAGPPRKRGTFTPSAPTVQRGELNVLDTSDGFPAVCLLLLLLVTLGKRRRR